MSKRKEGQHEKREVALPGTRYSRTGTRVLVVSIASDSLLSMCKGNSARSCSDEDQVPAGH